MTTSLSNQSDTDRGTPTWLNAIIVLLVLLIGLWAVWYFALRKPPEVALQIEEAADNGPGRRMWTPPTSQPFKGAVDRRGFGGGGPNGGGGGGFRGNPTPPSRDEAIRRNNSGGIRARHNDVVLSATYSASEGVHDVDLNYSFDLMEKWVTPQEIQLHMLAWRASNISNTGTQVGLTNDQRKNLLALKYHMPVTPEQLAKVRDLLTTWVAAENSAAAREKASAAVLAAMAEYGKLHEPATKSLFKARLLAIPTILSSEQLEKLREMQRAANAPAGAAPAVAPAVPKVLTLTTSATTKPALTAPAIAPAPTSRPAPATPALTTPTAGPAITLVPGTVPPTTRPTTKPAAP